VPSVVVLGSGSNNATKDCELVTADSDIRLPTFDLRLATQDWRARPVGPRYTSIVSAQTAQKTPLPRIRLVLSDVLSRLLPSNDPDIVDAGAFIACRGNVFTGRCLATDVFSGRAIPAFSRHVTIY
jgi:hypothetical protein